MEKKRKQLDIKSFLTLNRASLSPNVESVTTKTDSADARENFKEADEKEEEENSSESDNDNDCQGQRQTESLDVDQSTTGVCIQGNNKNDISCAVGTYLTKQERYKFLTEKWKPTKGLQAAQAWDAFSLQGLIPSRLLHNPDEDIFLELNFTKTISFFLSFEELRAELALWRAKCNGQNNSPLSALEPLQGCDNPFDVISCYKYSLRCPLRHVQLRDVFQP